MIVNDIDINKRKKNPTPKYINKLGYIFNAIRPTEMNTRDTYIKLNDFFLPLLLRLFIHSVVVQPKIVKYGFFALNPAIQ